LEIITFSTSKFSEVFTALVISCLIAATFNQFQVFSQFFLFSFKLIYLTPEANISKESFIQFNNITLLITQAIYSSKMCRHTKRSNNTICSTADGYQD